MSWYIKVLKNYFNFDGRARRKEYWMFTLIHAIIIAILIFAAGANSSSSYRGPSSLEIILGLYLLATLLPSLAVTVRRLHDTDRSGWWILVYWLPFLGPIFLLVFTVLPGTPGDNSFGSDPLDDSLDLNEEDDYYTPPGRQRHADAHLDQPIYQPPRKKTQGSPTYGAPRARNHDDEDFSPSMIVNNDSFGSVRRSNDKPYVDPFSKKDNGPSDEELFARFGLIEESKSENTPPPPKTSRPPRR